MAMNMGMADRLIRVVIGLVALGLAWGGVATGAWAIVLYVVAAVMLLTAFVGYCPLYSIFGWRTNHRDRGISAN